VIHGGKGGHGVIIRITGRVVVRGEGETPVTDEDLFRELDGASSDLQCGDYLDYKLADLGVTGGPVKLAYNPATGQLRVVTEYEAPDRLDDRHLALLVKNTRGQWSDGIGEGCFDRLGDRLGVRIDVSPFCEDKDIRVEQLEGGTPVPRVNLGLHKAAREGDLDRVLSLLDAGANVNHYQQGFPVLHPAILHGQVAVALELIARGADVHALDDQQDDALMLCALSNNLEDPDATRVARVLLERGVDVHKPRGKPGHGPFTVLTMARNRKKQQLTALLEEFGATE
jgi:hypothetical protein